MVYSLAYGDRTDSTWHLINWYLLTKTQLWLQFHLVRAELFLGS